MLNTIGMIATVAVAVFLLVRNKKPQENPNTTQDLLRYKSISSEGIIELPDGLYRLVIEVEPCNVALMSGVEQETTWTSFREMLSTLTVNLYFCVQSRHLDLKYYMDHAEERARLMTAYPRIYAYHQRLIEFLERENIENSIKDHRHYLILEINPSELAGGLQVQNEALSALTSGLQQKSLSGEEARSVAKQELENAAMIAQGFLNRMGMESYRLNHTGVLEMSYAALNRDLAPVARFEEMHNAEMFGFRTHTITPEYAMEVPPDVQEKEDKKATAS